MTQSPPLTGLRVLEFAGLAPGPFAGLLLADYGATVLRIDRAHPSAHGSSTNPPPQTPDQLTRRKSSIAVNTKTAQGVALIKRLIPQTDILIDPFRPGVLEKMGLSPSEVLLKLNPRLIVARMTGFRRDGKYADMAGHDINYIAVSGVLSMLGRAGEKPYAPTNIVVEANMVDGSGFLASMPRFAMDRKGTWDRERGTNLLDGGAPFYDTYETKDGGFMAVGALEPQFFEALLKGLEIKAEEIGGDRMDRRTWERQREIYTRRFKEQTRAEWEALFDGTDACCTPVLTQHELRRNRGFDQRPIVTLRNSPGHAIHEGEAEGRQAAEGQGIGVEGDGWSEKGLRPGEGGEDVLGQWMGWSKGNHRASAGELKPARASQAPTSGSPFQLVIDAIRCMIGLRPRLKARPSLLDLIQTKDIDWHSPDHSTQPRRPQTPPARLHQLSFEGAVEYFRRPSQTSLPTSPLARPHTSSGPYTSARTGYIEKTELETQQQRSQEQAAATPPSTPPATRGTTSTMPPKQQQNADSVENQVGSIFSISGPVIVAQHMIGCAMYELCKVG
ncbi:CoA-transferase family III, partial [Hortaea werneckii]